MLGNGLYITGRVWFSFPSIKMFLLPLFTIYVFLMFSWYREKSGAVVMSSRNESRVHILSKPSETFLVVCDLCQGCHVTNPVCNFQGECPVWELHNRLSGLDMVMLASSDHDND